MKHAKVLHWDDERSMGNSLLVTLKPGWRWAFDPATPCHVEGFDRVADAKAALRTVVACECAECKVLMERQAGEDRPAEAMKGSA